MNVHDIKQEIIKKYGSIHAFCKNNTNLTRATVYLILSDKYAGKKQKQLEKIKAALNNCDIVQKHVTINENKLLEVLLTHKCNHCRLLRKNCSECKNKTQKEANAVYNYISGVL